MTVKKIAVGLLCVLSYVYAKEEARCAIDIGSGWMKMQIASVDCESNRIVSFLDEPFLLYVPLANYYAQEGELNEEIQQAAIDAFRKVLLLCKEKNILKLGGVATEIFRKSGASGEHLFNTLQDMAHEQFGKAHVQLKLISQELEGELGFLTAAVLSPETDPSKLVSWDSGNASFQLVMEDRDISGCYRMLQGATGSAPAIKLFVESIRNRSYQRGMFVNPLEPKEIEKFIDALLKTCVFSEAFAKDIHMHAMDVVGIGAPTSIFAVAAKAIGKDRFSYDELGAVLPFYATLPAHAPELSFLDAIEPETVITRLILLYSVMQKLCLSSVSYKASTGNTLGILLSRQFWN